MKNHIKTIMAAAMAIALGLTSCNKDSSQTQTSDLKNTFSQTRVQSQTFTANAGNYSRIVGTKGTVILISPGSLLHQDGSTVTGTVNIELKEIYSAGDMILSNTTTTSNGNLLQSSGEIYLQATQSGENLRIRHTLPLTVEYQGGSTSTSGMMLFNGQWQTGTTAQDSILNWNADTTRPAQIIQDTMVGPGYMYVFSQDTFGWSNCDRFYSLSGGTAVAIQASGQFNGSNTAVYMVFNSEHTVATADRYTSATNTFGFHSDGHTPLGLSVTIVAMAKIGTQYYSCIVPTTTTTNMLVPLNMQATTLPAFKTAVSAL